MERWGAESLVCVQGRGKVGGDDDSVPSWAPRVTPALGETGISQGLMGG